MKIIQVDNFNRDNIPDKLICGNIINKEYGEIMTDSLNLKYSSERSQLFALLVEDNYKLITLEDIYG